MKIDWDKILFYLFILIVFTLPFQVTELLLPIHVLGSKFPVLELSRILTALGVLILGVKLVVTKKIAVPKDLLSVFLCIFVGLSILSFVLFPSSSGLLEVLRYVFYLGFLFLIVNAVRKKEQFKNVTKAFLISGFLVAFFAVFQYFTGIYLWNSGLDSTLRRVNATFFDPNALADFMGLVILVAAAYYSQSQRIREQVFAAVTAVLALTALFYTFSRGGLTAFVVSILALSVVLPKYAKNLFLYIVLIGVSVLVILTTPDIGSRISDIYVISVNSFLGNSLSGTWDNGSVPTQSWQIISGEDKDKCLAEWETRPSARYKDTVDSIVSVLPLTKDREATVGAGVYMLIDNPVFGVGLGNFQEKYLGEYCHLLISKDRPVTAGNPITLSHSSFVTIAAEMGLIGIAWLLGFVGTFFWLAYRILKKRAELNAFVSAIAAGMVLILIHTQVRGGLFPDPYFWLLAGLLVSCSRLTLDKR
jgi:O-antigen ligase